MKTFKFDKLIRDKDKMIDVGALVSSTLSEDDIFHYFKLKIVEEAAEVLEAKTREELIEELADCLEVIHGFARFGIGFETIEQVRKEKRDRRGGFEKAIIIDTVTLDAREEFVKYRKYLESKPDKYPVVSDEGSDR